jgi:hypothetical protein
MKSILTVLALMLTFVFTHPSFASTGITINAAEIGVGKFHRMDNTVHPYVANSGWAPFVLQGTSVTTPIVQTNANGSFSIFFSSLDELMTAAEKISKDQNRPISIINLHGHGLPGGMWFPKDDKTRKGFFCGSWRQAAAGTDQANYDQYYSKITKDEVLQIRASANARTLGAMDCTTGLAEWTQILAKHPLFKAALASDLQVHLLSCVVGLGSVGDDFTKGLAQLLITSPIGRVQSSEMFGLGDWSMPEGMGFWDYLNDTQLAQMNATYPVDRQDREQALKGTIRFAGLLNNTVTSTEMPNQDFMLMDDRNPGVLTAKVSAPVAKTNPAVLANITSLRIPGTTYSVKIRHSN